MARFAAILMGLLLPLSFAQASSVFTYEGYLEEDDGFGTFVPFTGTKNISLSIVGSPGGCVLYSETHSTVTVTDGEFSVKVGNGSSPSIVGGESSLPGLFEARSIGSCVFDGVNGSRSLHISVEGIPMGSVALTAAPMAMSAANATKLDGKSANQFVEKSIVPACSAGEALHWSGTAFTCVDVGTVISVTAGTNVSVTGTAADPVVNVADASETVKGVVELATSAETTAGLVIQANDPRLPSATCASGNKMRWDGSAWVCETDATGGGGGDVFLTDLKSSAAGPLFDAPNCASNQTLSWSAVTDQFSCIGISLNASAITAGTLDIARAPFGTANQMLGTDASGNAAEFKSITAGAGIQINHSAGGIEIEATGGSSDNLGNHTAAQNFVLGTHWLSGDGQNEGIKIRSDGHIGLGLAATDSMVTVGGDVRFKHLVSSPTITSGFGALYVMNDDKLYFQDSSGTVTDILALGSGGGTVTSVTGGTNVSVTGTATDPVVTVADASTTAKGVVELATDGESAANLAVQANDSRLSDARTPTAHTHPVSDITSGAGLYLTYMPNNVECADGEVLKWTAANRWECAADDSGGAPTLASDTAAGIVELATSAETTPGLAVQASDTRLSDARAPTGTAGGDLGGTYPEPAVVKIQGRPVNSGAPVDGTFLRYNGTEWMPMTIVQADIDGLTTALASKLDAGNMPSMCGPNQTLTFSSPTGTWVCTIIALSTKALSTTAAITKYVNPSGNDACDGSSSSLSAPPSSCAMQTLKAALDSLPEQIEHNVEIILQDGPHSINETIVIGKRGHYSKALLTIRAASSATLMNNVDSGGPGKTGIVILGGARNVHFKRIEFRDFNGQSGMDDGVALRVEGGAAMLEEVQFTNNRTAIQVGNGGGAYFINSGPSTISLAPENKASGITVRGGEFHGDPNADLTIEGTSQNQHLVRLEGGSGSFEGTLDLDIQSGCSQCTGLTIESGASFHGGATSKQIRVNLWGASSSQNNTGILVRGGNFSHHEGDLQLQNLGESTGLRVEDGGKARLDGMTDFSGSTSMGIPLSIRNQSSLTVSGDLDIDRVNGTSSWIMVDGQSSIRLEKYQSWGSWDFSGSGSSEAIQLHGQSLLHLSARWQPALSIAPPKLAAAYGSSRVEVREEMGPWCWSMAPKQIYTDATSLATVDNTCREEFPIDAQGNLVLGRAPAGSGGWNVDFAQSNMITSSSNCGTFNLHNLKSGSSYMLVVEGTGGGLCSFNAYSDAGSASLTVKMPEDHGPTVVGKHTIYNFAVVNTTVYVSWTPGL